jgi:hypothetical protein
MCQSCIDIDKQIERYRELLQSIDDPETIERIKRLIGKLYGRRVRRHRKQEE